MADLNNTQLQAIRQAVREQAGGQVDKTQLTINVPGYDGPLIVNAQSGSVYEPGNEQPIANINGAPAAANTASAPRPYRGDAGIVSDIQRFAQFAQNGGFEALDGVKISSTIDGIPGGGTGRSMHAMSGLSYDEMKDMPQADFTNLMDQKMQDDPDFRDAVITGLKEAGPDNADVQEFLKDRGVDSIEALEAKYTGAEATVDAPETTVDVVEIPRSSSQFELQSLVVALGGDVGRRGIDGDVGSDTNAGLESLGIPGIGNRPSDEVVADTNDQLRDMVRQAMTPEKFEALVEKADNPKDICALQSALRAMGHDVALDVEIDPKTQGAIDAVRTALASPEMEVPAVDDAAASVDDAAADPLSPTQIEEGGEAQTDATVTAESPKEISTAFDGANGEALMFMINPDGTIKLAHAENGTDADETTNKIDDRVRTTTLGDFDALLAENPDALRDGMMKAITAHLGIGEGGNAAFVQADFDKLWDQTEYWGSSNPDNIGEFAYNVLSDIKSSVPSVADATAAENFKISDIVDVMVSPNVSSSVVMFSTDPDLDSQTVISQAIKEDPDILHAKIKEGVEALELEPDRLQKYNEGVAAFIDQQLPNIEGTKFADMQAFVKEAIAEAVNELAPKDPDTAPLAQPGTPGD